MKKSVVIIIYRSVLFIYFPHNKSSLFSNLDFFFPNSIIMTLTLICDFQKCHYNVHETKSANQNTQMRNSGTSYLHQFYSNWCITNTQLSWVIYKAMFNLKAFLMLKIVHLCIFRSHLFRASQLLTFNDSHYGEHTYWNQAL